MTPWFDRLVHDLKGPLAPLQTAAFLLRGEQLAPERQRELLDVVERQTRRLNSMLGELGDWGRAQQSRAGATRRTTAVVRLLDLAMGSVPACTVDAHYEDGTDALTITGEEAQLVSMFAALLAFACARAAGRAPQVRVSRHGSRVRVCIDDTGAPLDAALLAELFERPQKHPADDGLGLRMLTAAAIARAHCASLHAEAAPDGGVRTCCELEADG